MRGAGCHGDRGCLFFLLFFFNFHVTRLTEPFQAARRLFLFAFCVCVCVCVCGLRWFLRDTFGLQSRTTTTTTTTKKISKQQKTGPKSRNNNNSRNEPKERGFEDEKYIKERKRERERERDREKKRRERARKMSLTN